MLGLSQKLPWPGEELMQTEANGSMSSAHTELPVAILGERRVSGAEEWFILILLAESVWGSWRE